MRSTVHHPPPAVPVDEFREDILARHASLAPSYRKWLTILGALFGLGVLAFLIRAFGDGFDERLPWGYYAATVAFLLTTAGTAPLVVIGLRAVRAHWRRPLARIAEIYGAVTVLIVLMVIPVLFLVPSAVNRRTFYFQGDALGSAGRIPGAPHVYDSVLLIAMVIGALGLLWASSRADRRVTGDRYGVAPGTWRGTRKQWVVQNLGIGVLGAFYFITMVGVVSLFSMDFALALVPGWKDAVFPAWQSLTGLQAGLATVVLTAYFARRYGGLEKYIHMENFWGASKLMLAFSLLWFYFGWSAFIIFWYGRMPVEQNIMQLLFFGPHSLYFYLAFIFSFVAPFLTLLWNTVRKTSGGPALAAAFILFGNLMDKLRVYVASYTIPNEEITAHTLAFVPSTNFPDVLDILIVVGGISGAVCVFLLVARNLPILSVWEMAEGLRLRAVRPFLRTYVSVLGKSE